jgi:hypothetical protein
MPNVVARKSIAAKYCRDERWDIFGRLIQLVCGEYEEKTKSLLSPMVLANAMIAAGGRKGRLWNSATCSPGLIATVLNNQ